MDRLVDGMGFEITGYPNYIAKLGDVIDQYSMEAQERDAEWCKYLDEFGIESLESRKNDLRLIELTQQGFPDNQRREMWRVLLKVDTRLVPGYYNELLTQANMTSNTVQEIQQDVERTFPNHVMLQDTEGRDKLQRVLIAYSMRNPVIGYCQSMNFVSFFLLLVLGSEEEAFWCLVALVEELFPDYYSRALLGAQVDQRTFMDLMDEVLPEVSAHFKKLGVVVPMVCAEWFLCLFATTLSSMAVLVVWDNVFFRGPHVVAEVALAIMQQLNPKIVQTKSVQEIVMMFENESQLLSPLPLMFCGSTLSPSRSHFQALRMKHWQLISKELTDLSEKKEMRLLQERTRFDTKKLKDLREEFKVLSMDGSGITFLQFQQVLNRVLPNWAGGDSETRLLLERIFEVFDEDSDKMLDFKELMCGLSILYQGTLEEKLQLIFKSFDVGNKNYLTRAEVLRMFDHVYRTFYRPIIHSNIGPDSEEDDIVREKFTAVVNKVFEYVDADIAGENPDRAQSIRSGEGNLTIDGLRHIIIIHPLILECFQPVHSSPTTTKLYASESQYVVGEISMEEDKLPSLHLVDIINNPHLSLSLSPPSSPPPQQRNNIPNNNNNNNTTNNNYTNTNSNNNNNNNNSNTRPKSPPIFAQFASPFKSTLNFTSSTSNNDNNSPPTSNNNTNNNNNTNHYNNKHPTTAKSNNNSNNEEYPNCVIL